MIRIIVIRVVDRIKEAGHTQLVLSKHADIIRARLGFHELDESRCSREGYILLYLVDNDEGYKSLAADLDRIYGIVVKEMLFDGTRYSHNRIEDGTPVAVLGLVMGNRQEKAAEVQKVLTSFGCSIRTRLGLNTSYQGSAAGLILLELTGMEEEMNRLIEKLVTIDDIQIRLACFD